MMLKHLYIRYVLLNSSNNLHIDVCICMYVCICNIKCLEWNISNVNNNYVQWNSR